MTDQAQIDQLINAFFSTFDNRGKKTSNFEHLKAMFIDSAMIYKHNGETYDAMSVDEFITPRQKMLVDGTLQDFYEWEVEQKTTIEGCIASRICRYGKSGSCNGEQTNGEGRKHIQLINTPAGWKIANVIWQDGH